MKLSITALSLALCFFTTAHTPLRTATVDEIDEQIGQLLADEARLADEFDDTRYDLAEIRFRDNRSHHLACVLNKFKKHCRNRLTAALKAAEVTEAEIEARIPSTVAWHESAESYELKTKRQQKRDAKQLQKIHLTERILAHQERQRLLRGGFDALMQAAGKNKCSSDPSEKFALPLLSPFEAADPHTRKQLTKRRKKLATQNRHRDAREKDERLWALEQALEAAHLYPHDFEEALEASDCDTIPSPLQSPAPSRCSTPSDSSSDDSEHDDTQLVAWINRLDDPDTIDFLYSLSNNEVRRYFNEKMIEKLFGT